MVRKTAFLLLLSACAGGGDLPVNPSGSEFRLAFEPPFHDGISAFIGFSGRLSAKVVDRRGKSVVPDEGPLFHSTNPAAVAVDAEGRFSVISPPGGTIIAVARVGDARVTGGVTVSVFCTTELRMDISPQTTSLAVGERFTPTMTVSTCGGHVPVSTTVTWSASDTTVLSVQPSTGETLALRPGNAYVQGRLSSPQGAIGVIPVTVR